MTDLDKLQIERDAHRYWLGLMLVHAAVGIKLSKEVIEQHLRGLKNGDPLENLPPNVSVAQWDEENFRRFPPYEAVALEIIERLEAYKKSRNINDLPLLW